LLISAKARVNPRDSEGNTALHLACEEGHGDTAVVLIEHNADADLPNADGKTPIEVCSTKEVAAFVSRHLT
jgi:26S proteasome non-ATPase regulatory subunit 10